MEITRTPRAEAFELKLKGRMDAIWSDHVGRALEDTVRAGQHAITLDMAEVDYISSAGIRVLVMYARQLKSIQGQLAVARASQMVKNVLELAGLHTLLETNEVDAVPQAVPSHGAQTVSLSQAGASAEVFELEPSASLQVRWAGEAAPWLAGQGAERACSLVDFPLQVMGVGLGAFGGGGGSDSGPLGEFLAAGGAAVCQPADGSHKPDYMLVQGALTPAVRVAYGILGEGDFAQLLRFDKGATNADLPLSLVVSACLEAVRSDAVGIVMVAETASLIGASLQKPPGSVAQGKVAKSATECANGGVGSPRLFRFPEIRDWLSFTAEAAFTNSVSLVAGFAAKKARAGSFPLLKPLLPSGELCGHFHAAAFPYRPLRKGKVELAETVLPLFEIEHVLGVLHLVNDWRASSGAGESRFLRGACWCAPLTS